MTNYEFYKEKIQSFMEDYHNGTVDISVFPKEFDVPVNNSECLMVNVLDWVLSEHKEPYKLTETEKMILDNVNEKYYYVFKIKRLNTIYLDKPGEPHDTNISDIFPNVKFDGLEWDVAYIISDVLNNCEVI